MKKSLITELNRQFELMGIKKIITESIMKDWGLKFIYHLKFQSGVEGQRSYAKVIDETFKDINLGQYRVNTIEDLEKDMKLYYLRPNSGEKPRIPESVYNKFAEAIISKITKESSEYKNISKTILDLYRYFNNFVGGSQTGTLIDEMIAAAQKAGKDETWLNYYQDLTQKLVNMNIVDESIPQLIKNIYFKAEIPTPNISTIDGIVTYMKTLPGIKQIWDKICEDSMNETGLRAAFDQVDSLIRQFDDAIINERDLDFDIESTRLKIAKLLEQISYGEPSAYKRIWEQVKSKLPKDSIKLIEDKNGSLNYSNVKEWFEHFSSSVDGIKTPKPNEYVSRLQALVRIFKDPTVYDNMSGWAKAGRSAKRVLNEYLIGSARNKKEIDQLLKGLGKYGKRGFNIGERVIAVFFYYPLIGAALQTLGDYIENRGGITNDGKGWGPNGFLKDIVILHGETWETPGKRVGGNTEALWNSLTINFKNAWPLSKVPSWQKISALSPALADFLTDFQTTKTGDRPKPEDIKVEQNRIYQVTQDTLQQLKTEGINPVNKLIEESGNLPLDTLKKIMTDEVTIDTTGF